MRIYIFGASGAGTSTLGSALSKKLNLPHFDADDFYWVKTDPPFTVKREHAEREKNLIQTFEGLDNWILTGSMMSWGKSITYKATLNIFLFSSQDTRLKRIQNRSSSWFGARILEGGDMYTVHQEFIAWILQYDDPSFEGRNLSKHENFINASTVPTLKIYNDQLTIDEEVDLIVGKLKELQ